MQGVDPATNKLVADPEGRIRQAFLNIRLIAQSEGASLQDCVRLTIYVGDLAKLGSDPLKADNPALYDALLRRRNLTWADRHEEQAGRWRSVRGGPGGVSTAPGPTATAACPAARPWHSCRPRSGASGTRDTCRG